MRKIMIVLLGIVGIAALAWGIFTKLIKGTNSVSIIGGADGPTSIFLVGKVGSDFSIAAIVGGVVLLIVMFVLIVKRK